MRFCFFVLVVGIAGLAAASDCPIQPRHAFIDATGTRITIRYYNSGAGIVRGIQFVLKNGTATLNLAARDTLRPQKEGRQIFRIPNNLSGTTGFEMGVTRVSFDDRPTWISPHENSCVISLSRQ